jgi:hypothetical protein
MKFANLILTFELLMFRAVDLFSFSEKLSSLGTDYSEKSENIHKY